MSAEKSLRIKGRTIAYKFRHHPQSRSLRVSIRSDGQVLLTAPKSFSQKRAESFLLEKGEWVLERLDEIRLKREEKPKQTGPADYVRRKAAARKLILAKLGQWAEFYGIRYGRVSIRNQRSRWGSCSAERNLSFNYRLVYLTEEMIDYVVVHELCHLKEMNHSPRFWKLVAQAIPNYKNIKKELKEMGLALF